MKLRLIAILFVGMLVPLVGCKPRPADPAKIFQAAGPEEQARWEIASAAAKTNNYVTAILTLKKLQTDSQLTPEQQGAVTAQMAAVNERLATAVQQGDPAAKQAMEEIRARWRKP